MNQPPHLRPLHIISVNCGRSGISGSALSCAAYGDSALADVMVLTETHLRPGMAASLPGYELLHLPRAAPHTVRRLGGVAVAVSTTSSALVSSTVLESCGSMDALCVRVDTVQRAMPLYIIAVYIPPCGAEFECDCGQHACQKAHVATGLAWVQHLCRQLGGVGDVMVIGDMNANWQQPNNPRRQAICQALLGQDACLAFCHPAHADGTLVGTRSLPDGRSAVLDMCLLSLALAEDVEVTVSDGAVVADHNSLHVKLHRQPGVDRADQQQQYIFPPHALHPPQLLHSILRMDAHMLELEAQLHMQAQVAQQMPSLRQLSTPGDNGDEDMLLHMEEVLQHAFMSTKHKLGMTRQVRGNYVPRLHRSLQFQREKERIKRRLLRVSCDGQPGEYRQLQEQLEQVTEEQRQARGLDRRQEREWQRCEQKVKQDVLLNAWLRGDARLLASERGVLSCGRLANRQAGRRAARDAARITSDVHAWYDFLSAKYAPQFLTQEAAAMPYNALRADLRQEVVAARCDVPVTADEVRLAGTQLRAQASAIGIPVNMLKLLLQGDVAHVLASAFQRAFDEGSISPLLCTVRAMVLYKKGDRRDKSNYRIIGVGTAIARLFQVVLLQRLLAYSTTQMAISVNQHGFVFGRSTEQCIFTMLGALACANVEGRAATAVFLDLAGAFASTPHAAIMCRLRDMGVPRYLWRTVDGWLSQQRMFVQLGQHRSPLFPVNIGVVEGSPVSPLQFVLVLNVMLRPLDHLVAVPSLGLKVNNSALTIMHKWFADDGAACGESAAAVQPVLSACSDIAPRLGMTFNVGVTKTAAMRFLPVDKRRRQIVTQQLQLHPEQHLRLSGQPVPYADSYKYLGIWVHGSGYTASVHKHTSHVQGVCAAVTRQAMASELRQVSLFTGLCTHMTFWRPRLTYGLGYYASTVHESIQRVEEVVLRLACGAANVPVVVLRSIMGLPSFHCQLQQQQLGMLCRVLSSPPGDQQRHILAHMVQLVAAKPVTARYLWWSRMLLTLSDLDAHMSQGGVDATGAARGTASWAATVAHLASQPQADIQQAVLLMQRAWKRALLPVEQHRRLLEVQRCATSLEDVQELLVTPNFAPFIVEPRSKACQLRIQLRGGVRTLFDAQYRHVDVCPWCGRLGAFTVSHLLRDCPSLDQERIQCWQETLRLAIQQDVMAQHDVTEQRQCWYLLMVGAAVPRNFCKLHLDIDTHWAREKGNSATGHLRRRYALYTALLQTTGRFLVHAVEQTAQRLEEESGNLPQREPLRQPRQAALRWTARQLQHHRILHQQQQQQQQPHPPPVQPA